MADAQYRKWLHPRRHLATVQDRRGRDLAYVVEYDELEHHMLAVLAKIRERDGAWIAREVSARLAETLREHLP